MMYFKVFAYSNGSPSYWIGKAENAEDAIKKSNLDPLIVMDVWILDEWIEFCNKRKGTYFRDEK